MKYIYMLLGIVSIVCCIIGLYNILNKGLSAERISILIIGICGCLLFLKNN